MSVGNGIRMCFSASSIGQVMAHIESSVLKDSSSQTVAENKKATRFVVRERKHV